MELDPDSLRKSSFLVLFVIDVAALVSLISDGCDHSFALPLPWRKVSAGRYAEGDDYGTPN